MIKRKRMKAFIVLLLCFVIAVSGSSHSESPSTASNVPADIADFYAFMSYEAGRSQYMTFLMNVYPLQTPYGGPNYFTLSDSHFYEIYVDANTDGFEDYSFQFIFGSSLPAASAMSQPFLYYDDYTCSPVGPPDSFVALAQQPNIPINTGIELVVGPGNVTASIRVALKVAGFILNDTARQQQVPTPGSLSLLNWNEYYSINLITGPVANGTVSPVGNLNGVTSFGKPFDYAGQFSFGQPATYENYALSFIQTLNLAGLFGGACSLTNGKAFVGQRSDPFWISLGRIFDYLNFIPVGLQQFNAYTIAQCATNNDLREKNIDLIALEIPVSCFGSPDGIINTWTAVRRLFHTNNDTNGVSHVAGYQVSRLGNPLVNELVIGLVDKVRFNTQTPRYDADPVYGFLNYVQYPTLPHIISGRYLAAVNQVLGTSLSTLEPLLPRNDLVTIYLTGIPGVNQGQGKFAGEVLRLNTKIAAVPYGSQNPLGIVGQFLSPLSGGVKDLAGFPNGRRPGDDIVDISLMVFMGAVCTQQFLNASINLCTQNNNFSLASAIPIGGINLRDGSPVIDTNYKNVFPYLNTPTPGSYLDDPTGTLGNVVTDPTKCYGASQHGRCPICPGASTTTTAGTTATTASGTTTCAGTSLVPLSFLVMIAAIALTLLFM